jgi:hypothetical protein
MAKQCVLYVWKKSIKELLKMKLIDILDIIVRTVVLAIAIWGFGYLVPKIIIPDVIRDFKRYVLKPQMRIEMVVYKGKKKLWDNRSTFNKTA